MLAVSGHRIATFTLCFAHFQAQELLRSHSGPFSLDQLSSWIVVHFCNYFAFVNEHDVNKTAINHSGMSSDKIGRPQICLIRPLRLQLFLIELLDTLGLSQQRRLQVAYENRFCGSFGADHSRVFTLPLPRKFIFYVRHELVRTLSGEFA